MANSLTNWEIYLFFLFAITLINVPFGYLRRSYPKFSRPWARCLYIPITINIILRRLIGLSYKSLPFLVLGVVLGQYLGSFLKQVQDKR